MNIDEVGWKVYVYSFQFFQCFSRIKIFQSEKLRGREDIFYKL